MNGCGTFSDRQQTYKPTIEFPVCWCFQAPFFCVRLAFVNASRPSNTSGSLLRLVCARFIFTLANRLFTGLKRALFVLELALKPVSCLCLSEKEFSTLKTCLSFPRLRNSAAAATLFSQCSSRSIHSCDERDLGLFRGPRHDVYNIHFFCRSRRDILS